MSVKLMVAAWKSTVKDPFEISVLVALADQANDQGICWPSTGSLSKKTRMSPRTLFNVLNRLEIDDHVERSRRHRHSTVYLVHPRIADGGIPDETGTGCTAPGAVHQMQSESAPDAFDCTGCSAPRADRTQKVQSKIKNHQEPASGRGAAGRAFSDCSDCPEFPDDYPPDRRASLVAWWHHKKNKAQPYGAGAWQALVRAMLRYPGEDVARDVEFAIMNNLATLNPARSAFPPKKEETPGPTKPTWDANLPEPACDWRPVAAEIFEWWEPDYCFGLIDETFRNQIMAACRERGLLPQKGGAA